MATPKTSTILFSIIIVFIFLASPSLSYPKKTHKPCKTLTLFLRETLYNGSNSDIATSAIVAAPYGASLLSLADQFYFGDVVVFDNPLTLDNDTKSEVVGRAQGTYLYVTKNTYTAWHAFSLVFNNSDHRGTVELMGLNPVLTEARDVSVVGGTGDFFMHRGVATFTNVAVEWRVSYMIRVEVKFYECW